MDTQVLFAQLGSLSDQFSQSFEILGFILRYSPYWAPFVLVAMYWRMWMTYVRMRFITSQEYVLLEIRLPQEVFKTPVAMQAVFDGIKQGGGESTFIDRIWSGKVRVWYSLELVSHEGQVHLYIWTRKGFQRLIERTFYAHYPEIEISVVDDYALNTPITLEKYNVWGMDYKLANAIGVPIRTYIDYKLDSTQTKEEQKTDPLAHVLEYLGSMRKGEHMWIQILCRANKKEDLTWGVMRNVKDFEGHAMEEVSRIRKSPEDTVTFLDGKVGKILSDRQTKRIQAINKTLLTSSHWDVGIRGIYFAEHEHFDGTNISGLITLWQPFNAPGYNSIIIQGARWQAMFDYPWQDFNDMRANRMKVGIIDAYRRRSWFHAPYRFRHFMMTSEELATIFHIPGTVARTPTLQRIPSTRGQAPANLPI